MLGKFFEDTTKTKLNHKVKADLSCKSKISGLPYPLSFLPSARCPVVRTYKDRRLHE